MSDEGQYFTNREICRLAFKLAFQIKKKLRRSDGSLCAFADWFCGTGGFPAEYVKGVKTHLQDVDWRKDCGAIYCQDMNTSSVTTTLLNMLILTGIPFSDQNIRSSNSFSDAITTGAGAPFPGLSVDYCFMNPPYGGDKTKGKEYKFAYSKTLKAEDGTKTKRFYVNQEIQSIGIEDDDKVSAGVQLGMATLSADGGVCCLVLPQGFFFGASKKCVDLRKKISEEYKIWYVVDIAAGSFLNTGTKTSMIVFQKCVGATEKISFIGLDEKLLVEATLEELRAKNYSLNYKQYMAQSVVEVEGFEMMKLGGLIVADSGDLLPKDKIVNGDYPIIGGGKIIGHYNKPNRNPDEIVISRVGNACLSFMNSKYYLTDNALAIVSKDQNKMIIKYLYYYLTQNIEKLREQYSGTAQPVISKTRLYEIIIPLPSLERQQQIVESIDGFAQLAHHEEQALKMLEKQVMFFVKEMGRGQPRVKLGDIIELETGTYITKKTSEEGLYPVYGGGGVSSYISQFNRENKFVIAKDGVSEICARFVHDKFFLNHHGWTFRIKKECAEYKYIGNWLLDNQPSIYALAVGTAQKGINQNAFMSLEIPLPPLAEQQTLQSDFEEIRHKHAKIAEYKKKAQDAIKRLIPGA
jgi:type I restriction enzyme S subunit